MADQTAELDWKDGTTPVSRRFDDPYFSVVDGLAETRHVFLAGNGLPGRFTSGFQIAELGFGSGLNLFATLIDWRAAKIDGPLRFTSFEAFPMDAADMDKALSAFPEARAVAGPFLTQWAAGQRRIETDDLIADIRIGDARKTLADWNGAADAWFLDGFAPTKNPELWQADLMQTVAEHTKPGGTCATYTAAGAVRRALSDAGFAVTRTQGFGRKRHMTTAKLATPYE
ncbi:tRNA (5-methylaminomethyl-2-thiouridine)(34)-methyltransferase MnmD [Aliiroseovarius sp. YM-037]|uniref:tRNA (5-methylaminomethyl-2-thiouridine)(34)-methyltransferase MnmD n=1 Tax=Aliiroseovarius sp. YM-037 TaxID=3341728 RepID=UPI003A7F62EE